MVPNVMIFDFSDFSGVFPKSLWSDEGGNWRTKTQEKIKNRLKKNMKLQIDATVIYSLTEGKRDLDRKLTYDDLRIENPYNTYKNFGLPPGPISYVGYKTIELIFDNIGVKDKKAPYIAVQTDLILNETNSLGESLLTTAIIKNDIDLIKLLIKKNVNLHYKNQNNETALDLAISKENTNIINLLQKKEFKDLTLLTNKI